MLPERFDGMDAPSGNRRPRVDRVDDIDGRLEPCDRSADEGLGQSTGYSVDGIAFGHSV